MIEKACRVVDIEMEALELLKDNLDEEFCSAVEAIREVLDNGKKIVVVGVGKSGNIGVKIAATFNSTGANSVVLHSQNALHGDLGIVSSGDAVIALSYSGETAELVDLLPHIKRLDVTLVSITAKKTSTLGELSDYTLCTPIKREACPLGLAPTSSSTAALVMGDALAMVLLDVRGFTEKDFASYHPGGALGRALLTRVSDIMRYGEQLALCGIDATVMDTIKAMSAARSGACFILNEDETLAGVFSHGDFARAFQNDAAIGSKPVCELMTKDPVTVAPDALAVEAVKTIQQYRVDDVPVVDQHQKVLGVIDTQDFARLKLV